MAKVGVKPDDEILAFPSKWKERVSQQPKEESKKNGHFVLTAEFCGIAVCTETQK